MKFLNVIRMIDHVEPPLKDILLDILEAIELQYEELSQQVTKTEFNEFKEIVARLADAQERTDLRLEKLAEAQERTDRRLEKLTEAQERTDRRLEKLAEAQERTDRRLEKLAEAQERTDRRLEKLTEAQERTDRRLEKLTEAQERTDRRLEKLAEAQERTEKELAKLIGEHKVTRERLEGLSDTVGYTLENRAYKGLPKILKDMGITIEGRLIRKYLAVGNRERQVNIFGEARRDGERILILGEAKVRPSKKEINRFTGLCKRMAEEKKVSIFKVFVAHDFPPKIEAYIREKDILPVWSYELD